MAPPRKPKEQRARRNADTVPQTDLEFEPGEAPDLPTTWIDAEGNLRELSWSPLTLQWWQRWLDSPQAGMFCSSDWSSLLSTAFVAERFHRGFEVKYASELRMREAQFGATPLDRLRLRMAWREDAEKGFRASEAVEKARQKAAQQRYGDIHVVPKTGTDS
jgi:hypothetical protein